MPSRDWRPRPPGPAPTSALAVEAPDVDVVALATPLPKPSGRPPTVRYVGFSTTAEGREYTCRVSDGLGQRQFVLFITHKAFAAREARFQDAPDLCCARLQRELAANPELAPGPRLDLTGEEMLDYRNVREHRAPGRKRGGQGG